MRKILTAAVALAAVLAVPAVTSAHHSTHTLTVECTAPGVWSAEVTVVYPVEGAGWSAGPMTVTAGDVTKTAAEPGDSVTFASGPLTAGSWALTFVVRWANGVTQRPVTLTATRPDGCVPSTTPPTDPPVTTPPTEPPVTTPPTDPPVTTPPTDPPATTPPTDPAVTTPTTPPTDPAVTTPATDPAPTTPDTTPGTEPPSTTPGTDPAGTTPATDPADTTAPAVTVQTGPSVPPGPQGTLPATGPAAATSAIAATAAALILIGLVARRLAR